MAAAKLRQLGPYQLIEEVGAGGLGRVFRAVDTRSGKTVAVKILHDRFTRSRKFLGIFHRELLIVSGLHHKNIVPYLDGYFEPPKCYIVAEFVSGLSAYQLIKKAKRFPPLIGLCIALDILQGIDYLHLHDVIHSDLSAPNVLIDNHGRVMVTDFGLACDSSVEDYKNYLIGTPGYYSPEHISDNPIDPRTDIYCVGLILYELIAGAKAVPASQDRKVTTKRMKKISFQAIKSSDWWLQWQLRRLLKKTLAFRAGSRVQNTEQMMYQVYKILKKHGVNYSRLAIHQYLAENGLTDRPYHGKRQNIYKWFIP